MKFKREGLAIQKNQVAILDKSKISLFIFRILSLVIVGYASNQLFAAIASRPVSELLTDIRKTLDKFGFSDYLLWYIII